MPGFNNFAAVAGDMISAGVARASRAIGTGRLFFRAGKKRLLGGTGGAASKFVTRAPGPAGAASGMWQKAPGSRGMFSTMFKTAKVGLRRQGLTGTQVGQLKQGLKYGAGATALYKAGQHRGKKQEQKYMMRGLPQYNRG